MSTSQTRITRRQWARLAAQATAAASAASSFAQTAPSPTVPANPSLGHNDGGAVLDIADWSYYWYGIERVKLARGTMLNGGQIFVEHWIPQTVRHPFPIVLVHGGTGQALDFSSTPDGRRGWVAMLIEAGYKVYAIDRPGQGRSPYAPLLHGQFGTQAPTFEAAAAMIKGGAPLHTAWPGDGSAASAEIAQVAAMQCQPAPRNAVSMDLWGSRGAELLADIGPAIFLTHGDGASFAWATAMAKPALVKAIIAVEQPANSLTGVEAAKLKDIPVLSVSAEAAPNAAAHLDITSALTRAGAKAVHLKLADRGVRGNGPFVMMEKNNREALAAMLTWLDGAVPPVAPAPGVDPNRNLENTSVKLASLGSFWVGIQRRQMSYGTIPVGQMHVQYMIPAEQRGLPVVMVHGGGGQGTHMMGIGRRPGWVHFFVQAGHPVYWVDRPSYGRSPYHADALGASHLPIVPPMEGLLQSTGVFNTAQFPGKPTMDDANVNQFMAVERGNVSDEALHSNLVWPGGAELLDRIGPSIVFGHAFGGFFGWGVADRRPNLVKSILCMEINSNPFERQFRWGLTAAPMTFEPPVKDPSEFKLVDVVPPPDMPRPIANPYKLQAEPAHKWKNLAGIPIAWITSEYGAGGSPVAQVAYLKQVGCDVEMLRLRDYGITGNGNLMLMERNNHEIYLVVRDWMKKRLG